MKGMIIMFEKFERKLTKAEFDNLMCELARFHDNEKVNKIFFHLMENESYTWHTGRFTNKLSLIFNTNSNIINLDSESSDKEIWNEVNNEIIRREGKEKEFFLYINYHKDPKMWRLRDRQCMWSSVHASYKPLQNEYYKMFLKLKERKTKDEKIQREKQFFERISMYVDF